MNILALEFSSSVRSVAVRCGETGKTASVENPVVGTSGMLLIEQALSSAKLEPHTIGTIALGIGPGSYTGIRSAIAIAQGWALGREIKLIPVPSMDVLAETARLNGMRGRVKVVVDAQRKDVYTCEFNLDAERRHEISPLTIVPASSLSEACDVTMIGPGIQAILGTGVNLAPSASVLADIANKYPASESTRLEPIYLRPIAFLKASPSRH